MASGSQRQQDSENNTTNNEDESSVSAFTDDDLEGNYYTILGVSKDANEKDITQAYHRLGRIYHPDKHLDAEKKRNAQLLFARIKNVYDVLSNPHRRAIYDTLGVKGLKQDGLQIVIRSKTPQEIREEYERLTKEKEELRLEKLTYSQGAMTMSVNATRLFDSTSHVPFGIDNIEIEQSIDVPISHKDTLSIGGVVSTNQDTGRGSLKTNFRRSLSNNSYYSANLSVGSKPNFILTGYKRFTTNCSGSLSGNFLLRNGAITPSVNGRLIYRLSPKVVGSIDYRMYLNLKSYLTTAMEYDDEKWQFNLKIQLNIFNSYMSLMCSRTFLDYQLKLKSAIIYGYTGLSLTYGVEKQITKFSKIDGSIILNTRSGVILNLQLSRTSQTFILPIHLSYELAPEAVFYGTVAPLLIFYVAKKLIVDPYLKSVEEREGKKLQDKLKSEMAEKKKLALSAQELMKETVKRTIEREGPNGLIITSALYGKMINHSRNEFDSNYVVDVKIPLQFQVKDHALVILSNTTKADIEGFYDPCLGEKKHLYIEYKFNGESHKAKFEDSEIVRLPKKRHKTQNASWWS